MEIKNKRRFHKDKNGFSLLILLIILAILGGLGIGGLALFDSLSTSSAVSTMSGTYGTVSDSTSRFFSFSGDSFVNPTMSVSVSAPLTVTQPPPATGKSLSQAKSICEYDEIVKLADSIFKNTGEKTTCTVGSGGKSYTLHTKLKRALSDKFFCVDSTGFSGVVGEVKQAGVSCK